MTELEIIAIILSHLFILVIGITLGKYIEINIRLKKEKKE